MKRIRSKEKTKKIVSRKHISSRISNNTQREEGLRIFNSPKITNPILLYDENSSSDEEVYDEEIWNEGICDEEAYEEEVLLSESQEEITYINPIDELNFSLNSDTDSSDSEETEQEPKQTIIEESEANFLPHSGEYGPYFQNFTEMMFFVWINKHMICKLNLFYFKIH
jgi:hypothetical protein